VVKIKILTPAIIIFIIFIFISERIAAQTDPAYRQSAGEMNSSEIKLALNKLNTLGSVLYIAAHPDDENNGLLAYFAKGRLLRTGYLSLTRGDGGQNLIGSEQGDLLGVVRTQELLAARRIDGAEQFFTRAIDFGFSKSADETFRFWGKQKILSDVVWVIRNFRPDVIITRFHGTKEDGHGHHIASEILAAEAFKLAGDPTAFPGQLQYVKPWQAKRILWNAWLPAIERSGEDISKFLKVDAGGYNPLLGESYTEIAAESRSMHKTQGFGSSPQLGESINYFVPINGAKANNDLFDGINLTWNRVQGGEKTGRLLEEADKKFDPENPAGIIPILLKAYREMDNVNDDYWIPIKKKELLDVIRSCAGIYIQSTSSDYSAVPGEELKITSEIINRSNYPFTLEKVETTDQVNEQDLNQQLKKESLIKVNTAIKIPGDAQYSQPYWLKEKPGIGDYVINDQLLIGKAQNDPPLKTVYIVSAGDQNLQFSIPVVYKWNDPVAGAESRPFIIVPPVAINIESKDYLFPTDKPRKVIINLTANSDNVIGVLKLNLPDGWKADSVQKEFTMLHKHDELPVSFMIQPPASASDTNFTVEAIINGQTIRQGMVTISYSHIPTQTVFPPAEAKLIRLNVKKVINNIGYIMGPGDDVPQSLTELGYHVTLLSGNDIENGNLSKYDAIVTGVRVYNTKSEIINEQPKLLEYVKNGGTLVVQYNKNFGLVTNNIGPYPFHISNERVTDETSKVTFLNTSSPILNYPNKITEDDFDGWIQERGIYFADHWDPHYKTVIACNDPGEEPLNGGLIYTRYGKGMFIYTGYVWFRELPDGVPGAYKIFVNLISAGKAPDTVN
jgi:LmbE family N-acetylglucosaminyl deacetylase